MFKVLGFQITRILATTAATLVGLSRARLRHVAAAALSGKARLSHAKNLYDYNYYDDSDHGCEYGKCYQGVLLLLHRIYWNSLVESDSIGGREEEDRHVFFHY